MSGFTLERLRAAPGECIGLLGGSFNPAHEGHLAISLEALRRLGLARVIWLVSPQNPLKSRDGMAPLEMRVAEARRLARHPRLAVSAIEAALGTRFTADTIARLKARHPGVRFVFLMGADNLADIPRWQRWTRIFGTVPIAVFARPGHARALASKAAHRYAGRRVNLDRARRLAMLAPPAWVLVPTTHYEISASALRRAGLWPPRNKN